MHGSQSKTSLIILAALVFWLGTKVAHADDALQDFLAETLTAASGKYNFPAVAAVIQIGGEVVAEAAHGVRARDRQEAVTVDDRWHIGSNTKALTATMIARLVEQDIIRFEDSLAELLPTLANEMDPAYRSITLMQLLANTAGLPALTDGEELSQFETVIKSNPDVVAQRKAIVRYYLSEPPTSVAGSFAYSNLGFIIAASIAETRTNKSWEKLISEYVFHPLGINNAGFGAPGSAKIVNQPRGHRKNWWGRLKPVEPDDEHSDNFQAFGPAGTINISLKDWMRFAQDQLDGVHGRGKLLDATTYRKLHTPVTGNYALGWGAAYQPEDSGTLLLLTHSGSNGYWLAEIRIMPKRDIIVLSAINSGDAAADEAIKYIRRRIVERLKPYE